MNHFIPLQEAIAMTTLYRSKHEQILQPGFRNQNILPLSEGFDRSAFDVLLAKPGCAGLRIYYGMDNSLQLHAIIVATDSAGNDLLPLTKALETEGEDIIEKGNRCPDLCSDPSPLNS